MIIGIHMLMYVSVIDVDIAAQLLLEVIENKGEPSSLVKLVVELHPVQPQGMQKAFHHVHTQQHSKSNPRQEYKSDQHLRKLIHTRGMPE